MIHNSGVLGCYWVNVFRRYLNTWTVHLYYFVLWTTNAQLSHKLLYAFFWVIPRRLNFICRRFGFPKRRHIKFRRRGIIQKKAYKIQNRAKVWNQEYLTNYHTPTCFDTIVPSPGSLQSIPCQVTHVFQKQLLVIQFTIKMFHVGFVQLAWPRGLRHRSAGACLLRSWVRNPPVVWMSVCCEGCVLSGRGICDELIIGPEETVACCV
jgi:hypothetical protein